ncbi:helix-turn-helix protein [Melghirimyces profundicolus]|uniref:Helix-turn-helix protein n=1 Tax=Melghirimyces profundicolus TaxID=1242148 RepID=A0A2T6BRI9_9BACL|nr:helix-turn-helix domain-containing protein [Melghirimyces profundicolus]PTX58654.1 helix-turn-helix protein [Melghirimyces profundicolus]
MPGIGSQLRETRESMGLSLEQVQQSTKIHIEYLRALENDQFDTLPSPFYVRAFLRTYAHSLGLDAQPLLERYERMAGAGGGGRVPGRQPSRGRGRGEAGAEHPPFRQAPRLGRTYSPRPQRTERPRGQEPPPFAGDQGNRPRSFGQTRSFSREQMPPQQGTGRFPAVTGQHPVTRGGTQGHPMPAPAPGASGRGTGQPEQLQHTLTPRKVSMEVKRGIEEGDGKPKKGGASRWMVRVAAIGALLLVSIGSYTVAMNGFGTEEAQPETPDKSGDQVSASGSGTDQAKADPLDTPTLNKVESGSEIEGDLYVLENAKKLEVQIKATKGDTNIRFGDKVNQVDDSYDLKAGQQRTLPYDKYVWFRLTKPSNTEIKVNGEEIDTMAQDVPRSYRVKLKK